MSSIENIPINYPHDKDSKYHMNETKRYNEHNKPTVYDGPEDEWNERLSKETKKCSKCGESKLIMNYDFNCSGSCHFNKDGYRHTRPECKDCNKKEKITCRKAMEKSKANGEPIKLSQEIMFTKQVFEKF